MSVTWGEIKELVKEAGGTDDTPIDYFDTHHYPDKDRVDVYVTREGLVIQ